MQSFAPFAFRLAGIIEFGVIAHGLSWRLPALSFANGYASISRRLAFGPGSCLARIILLATNLSNTIWLSSGKPSDARPT